MINCKGCGKNLEIAKIDTDRFSNPPDISHFKAAQLCPICSAKLWSNQQKEKEEFICCGVRLDH